MELAWSGIVVRPEQKERVPSGDTSYCVPQWPNPTGEGPRRGRRKVELDRQAEPRLSGGRPLHADTLQLPLGIDVEEL